MPFPMVHLSIAKAMLPSLPSGLDAGTFFAGSLAPDSVHFRPDFHGGYKVVSHLCPAGWTWAVNTDMPSWEREVDKFLLCNQNHENLGFILGYCAHILADIAGGDQFWVPFAANHSVDPDCYSSSQMHQDCYEIDSRLYQSLGRHDEMWALLQAAQGVEIPGVVSTEETNRMLKSILQDQYVNRDPDPNFVFRHVTEEKYRAFIEHEAPRIARHLLDYISQT